MSQCWEWEELAVGLSEIDGYGLMTRESRSLDWASLAGSGPIYIPLLGRETELGSAEEMTVCLNILHGWFVCFPFREMLPPPSDSTWVTNGLYVSTIPSIEVSNTSSSQSSWRHLTPHEVVVQVLLADATHVGERDCCVYLLKAAAMRLLHIPAHIFEVLALHRENSHNDRHFATHCVTYRRDQDSHMLINAHPGKRACKISPVPTTQPTGLACVMRCS